MEGHKREAGLDAILKFRLEHQLKTKVDALAKRRRKPSAQFIREKLWQIVEEDERAAQAELPLAIEATHGGGR